jgi:hypothetical protein
MFLKFGFFYGKTIHIKLNFWNKKVNKLKQFFLILTRGIIFPLLKIKKKNNLFFMKYIK